MRRSMKFRVRVNKFYTFTASALIQVAGSPVYTFSIYAPALGSSLGLSHVQLEGLGSMLAFGNFLALLSGTFYEQMEKHNRMGPRITIWVGVVLGALGYGGLYLAASGAVQLSYPGLLAVAFIAGNSSSWFDTATIVTNVRNFPNNRGAVVGLLKSFVGLSGSIYSSVYSSSLMPDATAYLLLLAFTVSLVPLLLSLCVNHVPYVELAEMHSFASWLNPETRFLLTFIAVGALALYQMTSAILQGMGQLPATGSQALDLLDLNTVGMFGLLSVVLLVPWNTGGITSKYVHDHLADPEEKAGTIPQWIKQLQHTSQLRSATIRARLNSITAALEPSPEPSISPSSSTAVATPRSAAAAAAARSASAPAVAADDVEADLGLPAAAAAAAAVTASENLGHGDPMESERQIVSGELSPYSAESESDDDETTKKETHPLKKPLLQQQQHGKLHDDSGQKKQRRSALHSLHHFQRHSPQSVAPTSPGPVSGPVQCRHQFTNLSLSQAIRTSQFWLLFSLFLAGVGSCLTYLNNLGQITIALGGAPGDQVAFVSIFAVGNAAGRLLMGMIPENALHASGTPRTHWLLGTFITLTAAVLAATAATRPSHLYLLSLALGLCYGGVFCLIPAIAADVFGLRHFAANYSGLQTACAIACYVFPTQLAGFFYSKAVHQHGSGEPCIGSDCYGPTFAVEAMMCLLGCVAAGVVVVTTRGVYTLLSAHLHEVAEEEKQDMIEHWQAGHHILPAVRVPSDPTISSTTGVPVGQFGQTFHKSRGHNNATMAQLQHSRSARQQRAAAAAPLLDDGEVVLGARHYSG